jgi:ubiquinone/menaquinone biosynthesis C-methylase UbiE
LRPLRQLVIEDWVQPGDRVLDVGCGPGTLSLPLARRGATVTGIDVSEIMLYEARDLAEQEGIADRVAFLRLDATALADQFPEESFDVVVCSLVLSELTLGGQHSVLTSCRRLLVPSGRLLVVDETVPTGLLSRVVYWVSRWFWAIITWSTTRTTTYPLTEAAELLSRSGFRATPVASSGGSLQLILGQPAPAEQPGLTVQTNVPELRHRLTPLVVLKEAYSLLARIWPPYLSVRPGLYRVGNPGRDAAVLVTGNFDTTVRRLVRALRGQDVYLLVADSRGINVWCAAGGGHLTAEKVIAAVRGSGLDELVDHRRLILPQLCANGVHGNTIELETGWKVSWGPTRAADIPAYLANGGRKTPSMRLVQFPLADRMEMATVMALFFAPILAVVMLILRRDLVLPVLVAEFLLFMVAGLLWSWLPGYQGTTRGLSLAAIGVLGTVAWSVWVAHLPQRSLFGWCVGVAGLALFVGADFQGADPRRRGGEIEQMPKVAPIELALLAIYLVVPRVVGW